MTEDFLFLSVNAIRTTGEEIFKFISNFFSCHDFFVK